MSQDFNPFTLKGKRILVTGASSGIGRAIAINCSKMGASVLISGRNEARLNDTFNQLSGNNHSLITADLNFDTDLLRIVHTAKNLDGMVLSSGIGEIIPIKFCNRKRFDNIFNTNFFSNTELCRLLIKGKNLNNEASIVAISSIGGNRVQSFGESVYGASKAALSAWMRYLALELAAKKIRVNCILPGMVHTPLTKPTTLTQEQLDADKEKYPLKRYGEPDEIAFAAIYLLSDATKWVTGSNLVIDGGISM